MKTALIALTAALVLAAPATAAGLPAGWTHAEINVVIGRVPHTLVLDRGRVTATSAQSLTIREQDGNSVQVDVGPATQVLVDGRPGQLTDIRRGVIAVTERVDGGAARSVRVHVPPRLARLARR